MSAEAKLKYLTSKLWPLADSFRGKAQQNRKKAFRLKLLTALCSASIPVVLGLSFENSPTVYQHNIALTLGGIVALWHCGINGNYRCILGASPTMVSLYICCNKTAKFRL